MVILGNGQLTELTHQFSLKLIAKQLEVCLLPLCLSFVLDSIFAGWTLQDHWAVFRSY
jgi:hypothetical protein